MSRGREANSGRARVDNTIKRITGNKQKQAEDQMELGQAEGGGMWVCASFALPLLCFTLWLLQAIPSAHLCAQTDVDEHPAVPLRAARDPMDA